MDMNFLNVSEIFFIKIGNKNVNIKDEFFMFSKMYWDLGFIVCSVWFLSVFFSFWSRVL